MHIQIDLPYARIGSREWFFERNSSGPWFGTDKQEAGKTVYLA